MKKIFIISLLFAVAQSCTDETDETTNPSTDASAKVNGTIFTPTDTKATDTGTGMEVKLKDNSQEINLRLDDIVAGTYTVKNSSGGRLKAGFTVTALLVDNRGTAFYGTTGTVTLAITSDGKVAGTFTFSAKNTTGASTSVTDGKFEGLSVGNLSSLGCLLTRIDWSGYINEFTYDSDGNITSMIDIDGSYRYETNFSYANGKMVRALAVYSDAKSDFTISYDGSRRVNRIDEFYTETNSTGSTGSTIFSYDGSGRLSSIDEENEGNECLTYTGNNLTKYGGCIAGGEDFIYSLFDTKKNHGKLLLKAFQNQSALLHHFADGVGQLSSENNPGKLEHIYDGTASVYTYTYNEYNNQGYPLKITETGSSGGGVIALTYSNCD